MEKFDSKVPMVKVPSKITFLLIYSYLVVWYELLSLKATITTAADDIFKYEPVHDKTYNKTCVTSKDRETVEGTCD